MFWHAVSRVEKGKGYCLLGTFGGGMVHVLAAAAGVSVILARSAVAFAAVKYLAAAFLCFLGTRMILDARRSKRAGEQ